MSPNPIFDARENFKKKGRVIEIICDSCGKILEMSAERFYKKAKTKMADATYQFIKHWTFDFNFLKIKYRIVIHILERKGEEIW